MKRHSAKTHASRGQSLVEFALTITILLLLISGVIDVGRAVMYSYLLDDAAEEGALYGSVCPIPNNVEARTTKSLSAFNPDDLEVEVTCDPTSNCPAANVGESITVTVRYQMHFITPLGGLFFPDNNAYTVEVERSHLILTAPAKRATICTP